MNPHYRLYHPRYHRVRVPIFWWLGKWSFTRFVARELTSVFVAYSGILLLIQVIALKRGPDAFARFQRWLADPVTLAAHFVVLLFVLFHSITWIHLAPRAMVLKWGRRRVPDRAVLAGNYFAWIAGSALVVWFLRR